MDSSNAPTFHSCLEKNPLSWCAICELKAIVEFCDVKVACTQNSIVEELCREFRDKAIELQGIK